MTKLIVTDTISFFKLCPLSKLVIKNNHRKIKNNQKAQKMRLGTHYVLKP